MCLFCIKLGNVIDLVSVNFKAKMEQYIEATTVHGFSYISKKNNLLIRVFWSAIIMIGFSVAITFIHDAFTDWNENQTITTIKSIATPITNTQFPTVTVCPNEDTLPDPWSFLEKVLDEIPVLKGILFCIHFNQCNYLIFLQCLKYILKKIKMYLNLCLLDSARFTKTRTNLFLSQIDVMAYISPKICTFKEMSS